MLPQMTWQHVHMCTHIATNLYMYIVQIYVHVHVSVTHVTGHIHSCDRHMRVKLHTVVGHLANVWYSVNSSLTPLRKYTCSMSLLSWQITHYTYAVYSRQYRVLPDHWGLHSGRRIFPCKGCITIITSSTWTVNHVLDTHVGYKQWGHLVQVLPQFSVYIHVHYISIKPYSSYVESFWDIYKI